MSAELTGRGDGPGRRFGLERRAHIAHADLSVVGDLLRRERRAHIARPDERLVGDLAAGLLDMLLHCRLSIKVTEHLQYTPIFNHMKRAFGLGKVNYCGY